MQRIKEKSYQAVDYLFWIFLILFTNPGGIFQALGEDTSRSGTIDSFDFLFLLMFLCFVFIFKKAKIYSTTYNSILKIIIIFGLYYLIVYGFLIPTLKENPGYTPLGFYKKSRKTVYSLALFLMVYKFYVRSHKIFFKVLVSSSVMVLTLFFITFLTGIDILPIRTHSRGFIDVDRVFIASEGIMQLLIPIGVVIITFKSRVSWKFWSLLAFFMMFINYVLSITRRDIIGTFIYFLIAIVLHNYFLNKPLLPVKKILTTAIYLLIFGFFISLAFPKYYEAGKKGMEEAVHIVQYGETTSGKKDVRMGLGKGFMQNLIVSNIWFGTGFDNRWRGSGDKEGYETSDYPFLSALAMMGVFGVLVFLPVYVLVIRTLIIDIRFLKNNAVDTSSYQFKILMVFIVYMTYDMLQYMNWFLPVSLSRSIKWYVMTSMYLASREVFYNYFRQNHQLKIENNNNGSNYYTELQPE
ncbi:MAG: hypothetical protein QNJ57_03495 [Flavobacteriaceae bacterium]|nr:hypothetical protein [Flavobacteriaceae bacterium]